MFAQTSAAGLPVLVFAWIVQSTLVVCCALMLVRILHKRSPHLHHAILLVAMAKFIIPPIIAAPTGMFPMLTWATLPDFTVASGSVDVLRNQATSSGQSEVTLREVVSPTPDTGSDEGRRTTSTLGLETFESDSAPEPTTPWRSLMVLAATYVAGSLAVAWQLIRKARQLRALISESTPLATGSRSCHLLQLITQSRIRPRLLISDQAATPFAAGMTRPVVVLPAWVIEKLSPTEQTFIVQHELKHHDRLDVWVAWLQNLLTVVWWFHPAWWLLSRQLRIVREESCDASVLAGKPSHAHEYAQTLVSAARYISPHGPHEAQLVPGIFSSNRFESAFRMRIHRILTQRAQRPGIFRWVCPTTACVLAMIVLPGAAPSADKEAIDSEFVCLTGTVVAPDGRPVAGAKIVTYPRIPGDKSVTTETNGEGVFHIQGVKPLRPGRLELDLHGAVYKPGLALAAFDSMWKPCRVALSEPDRVQIIVETPEGKRLAGASVSVGMMSFRGNVALGAPPPDEMKQDLTRVADEHGQVTLDLVERASLRSVSVETERWGRQQLEVPRLPLKPLQSADDPMADEPMVVRLKPAGRIEGTAVTSSGEPMTNLEVTLVSPLDHAQGARLTTDALGKFSATLPTGRYRMAALAANHAGESFAPTTVHVKAEEVTKISITGQETATITGRVVTDQGRPAPNVPLAFWRTGDRRIVSTDDEGRYQIELGAGSWDYECSVEEIIGYVPPIGNHPRALEVAPGATTTLDDWVVTTGVVVSGRIDGIDTTRTRIRCVIAHHTDGQYYWAVYDADGKFEFTIPRGMAIQDIKRYEVRFVDDPIEVVSHDPLILKPSGNGGKPDNTKP